MAELLVKNARIVYPATSGFVIDRGWLLARDGVIAGLAAGSVPMDVAQPVPETAGDRCGRHDADAGASQHAHAPVLDVFPRHQHWRACIPQLPRCPPGPLVASRPFSAEGCLLDERNIQRHGLSALWNDDHYRPSCFAQLYCWEPFDTVRCVEQDRSATRAFL